MSDATGNPRLSGSVSCRPVCVCPRPQPAGAGHATRAAAATHLFHAVIWIRSHYGSVPGYLLAHGAEESELRALHSALTDTLRRDGYRAGTEVTGDWPEDVEGSEYGEAE